MFDHSIKVPRLYKSASKIAKEVSEGKGSIKQLVYQCNHPNIKALYALVVHMFQRTDDIDQLFKKSKLFIKEPRLDPWLAKILITELLWGKKKLPNQSKPVKTILAYEQIFKAHLSDSSLNDFQEKQVDKPRYVRINTLKISINEAIEDFRNEGWMLKKFLNKSDYTGFLQAVASLGEGEFMIDFHLPYLLIFPPRTQFYKHEAYKSGRIILQDKASSLPVQLLNPAPGSVVLDMCAAPGMKTTQCAAIMENKGKIIAIEIGKKRFETLSTIVKGAGATCVEVCNNDSLAINGRDYPDVRFILVDPSCSGSGLTDRIEVGQQVMDQRKDRLEKLAGFQIKMLRHALTRFPNVERVVYSTCSVYPEENEDVVRQVLESCLNFKLVPAKEFINEAWLNYGSPEFGDIGNFCLYAKPDIDLTSGFFVAVFERLQKGEKNVFLNTNVYKARLQNSSKDRQPKKENVENNDHLNGRVKEDQGDNCEIVSKRKKKDVKIKMEKVETEIKKEENSELNMLEEVKVEKPQKYDKIVKEEKRKLDLEEVAIKNENISQKIKKKKAKEENNWSEEGQNDNCEVPLNENKQKKKNVKIKREIGVKKAIKKEPDGSKSMEEVTVETSDSNDKKLSKKKKKNLEFEDLEKESEKNIKKRKENNGNLDNDKQIKFEIDESQDETSMKKRKKHKKSESGNKELSKKKKKNLDFENEDIEMAEKQSEKNTKKGKEINENLDNDKEIKFEIDESQDETSMKKRKKHKKFEPDTSNEDLNNMHHNFNEEKQSKKKKKKHEKNYDKSSPDFNEEEERLGKNEEVNKKKKKKKDKNQ